MSTPLFTLPKKIQIQMLITIEELEQDNEPEHKAHITQEALTNAENKPQIAEDVSIMLHNQAETDFFQKSCFGLYKHFFYSLESGLSPINTFL